MQSLQIVGSISHDSHDKHPRQNSTDQSPGNCNIFVDILRIWNNFTNITIDNSQQQTSTSQENVSIDNQISGNFYILLNV
jgi:hypothetical protein